MTAIVVDLPVEVYDRLLIQAQQQQKPVEVLASEWLAERSNEETPIKEPNVSSELEGLSERERIQAVLRASGMLVEPSPEARRNKPLTPEERAELAERVSVPGATPLSEIIIAEREGR